MGKSVHGILWFFASNYSSVTTYWFKWSLSREKFVFIGRKRALNEVSQVLWKIRASKFSNFLHEAAEKFKIASNDFFQKKYCTWVLGQKVTENEFFKFYNKLMHFDKFWLRGFLVSWWIEVCICIFLHQVQHQKGKNCLK